MNVLTIDKFQCLCQPHPGASSAVYMIYPAIVPFNRKWIVEQSEHLKTSIVVVYVPADDWNDALTPWPEPGETKTAPPFGGKAQEFLDLLQTKIIPQVEKIPELANIKYRDLLGVSLGGLFTLWQWLKCDTFRSIACLSGSFWYEGFLNWFESQEIPGKTGHAYFLLGEEEPFSHIKAFQSVGKNTEEIVKRLENAGIAVKFDWVPGNHFSDPVHRATLALTSLASS